MKIKVMIGLIVLVFLTLAWFSFKEDKPVTVSLVSVTKRALDWPLSLIAPSVKGLEK